MTGEMNVNLTKFRDFLGPRLRDMLDLLLFDMVRDGAEGPVSDLESRIAEVKAQIDKANAERHVLTETKMSFTLVHEHLGKFLNQNGSEAAELVMLRMVLKDRVESLDHQIQELRPNGLLREKGLLKARKRFLEENQELGARLIEALGIDVYGYSE